MEAIHTFETVDELQRMRIVHSTSDKDYVNYAQQAFDIFTQLQANIHDI